MLFVYFQIYKMLSHALFHLILKRTQWGRYFYYYNISDEEITMHKYLGSAAQHTKDPA